MGTLVSKFPEEAFWLGLNVSFRIPSLAWFLTDKGTEFIAAEYRKFNFTPEERISYEFDQEKVEKTPEKPIIIKEKVKSIKDFLKLWKK
jgi:hypothetical protein